MSSVTDVILITGYSEETYPNNDKPITKLNDYLIEHNRCRFNRVDEHAGGTKGFCTGVYICAVNYLNVEDFLEIFYSCKWTFPDTVTLMYKYENNDHYTTCLPKRNSYV